MPILPVEDDEVRGVSFEPRRPASLAEWAQSGSVTAIILRMFENCTTLTFLEVSNRLSFDPNEIDRAEQLLLAERLIEQADAGAFRLSNLGKVVVFGSASVE